MAPEDLKHATISELGELLKSRKVSAQDLAKEFGASKATLKQAKQVDGDIKRERFRGPLQGVPFSVRGLADTATVIKRLESAGGLLVESGVYSVGARAGGVTGMKTLRPTYGLVSRHGLTPLAWTLDTVEVACRTVEECGLVLQGIAGSDNEDPGSLHKSFYYTPQYTRAFADLRVGHVAPALASLAGVGVTEVEAKLPDLPYSTVANTVLACEGASAYEVQIQSGQLDSLVDARNAALFRSGLKITAQDYLKAQRIRRSLQKSFHTLFADLDALVLTDETPAILAGLPVIHLAGGSATLVLTGPALSENTLIALAKEHQKHSS